MESRYIDHDCDLTHIDIPQLRSELEARLLAYIARFQEESPPGAQKTVNSKGKRKTDLTIYTGTPGNVLLYYRLLRLSPSFAASLEQAISSTLHLLDHNPDPLDPPSFFCGSAGPLSLLSIIRKDPVYVSRLIAKRDALTHPSAQHDLLYGTAGYMYCLVLVLRHWQDCPLREDLIATLNTAADQLVRCAGHSGILRFAFPAKAGFEYIGAAHGSLGAVQALLISMDFLRNDYTDIVKRTIDAVVERQWESGNFPMSFEERGEDCVVHFCHGATGAVVPLLGASRRFGDERYRRAAEKAGETIWNRGLLLKGKGLCHGTSGSAYAFLSLYRATLAPIWLSRAVFFAHQAFLSPSCAALFASYDDPQRLMVGEPDTPWSLMEGEAGALCLWADVLMPELSAFPGYEV